MSENVLVVCAHPDDETLGMGGTIARLVAEGHTVTVSVVGDGVGARAPTDLREARIHRAGECAKACAVLGAEPGFVVGFDESGGGDDGGVHLFPDNMLDTVPLLAVVRAVESLIEELQPTTVYTHHAGDLNIDHQIVARAVATATRPAPGQVVRNVYAFEVPESTGWAPPGCTPFVPTRYVALTEGQFGCKKRALACYESERRDPPHPRSLAALAALAEVRGSQCGHELAEAFVVIKEVVA